MILHSPSENENANFVMPVWTAGIQFPRMLPETSISAWIPCWDDTIEGTLLEVTEVSLTPKEHAKSTREKLFKDSMRSLIV